MNAFSIREFKPTIIFLVKFVGFYLVGNLLYGFYVAAYAPAPDPATNWVTDQTAIVLKLSGHPTEVIDHPKKATTILRYKDQSVVSVYEGCNGLNIFIIFAAFIFAFGPINKIVMWFIPMGILLIHASNLLRIAGLFLITLYEPELLYFTHKYLFTIFIYLIVFLLWVWWIRLHAPKQKSHAKEIA
jgi:exosortase family protein XrtF